MTRGFHQLYRGTHLPELDDLHGDEQRDGHQVGVQDPERDQVDEELRRVVGVVALCIRGFKLIGSNSYQGPGSQVCHANGPRLYRGSQ